MIKQQILSYITATINQYARAASLESVCVTGNVINNLTDLESFVSDLNEDEEVGEEIYVKRIVELQEEVEDLKELRFASQARLKESEHNQDYSNELWKSVGDKLTEENENLKARNKLLFEAKKLSVSYNFKLEEEISTLKFQMEIVNYENRKLTENAEAVATTLGGR